MFWPVITLIHANPCPVEAGKYILTILETPSKVASWFGASPVEMQFRGRRNVWYRLPHHGVCGHMLRIALDEILTQSGIENQILPTAERRSESPGN